MHLSALDLFFWAAGLFGHAGVLTVLIVRRRMQQLPWFTAWIALSVVKTLALFAVLHLSTYKRYFYSYWAFTFVEETLQVVVLYEIARKVFRPMGSWAPDVRRGWLLLGMASVAVAAGLTWLAAPPARAWQQAIVLKFVLFSAALMSEIFVAMIALSVTAGLPWRTHVARVAQGLGVYSVVELLIEGINNMNGVAHGHAGYTELAHIRMVFYLGCLVYWIVTLWQEAPAPQVLSARARGQLSFLQSRVAQGLGDLRERKR